MPKFSNIVIIGAGYVGMSLALILSKKHIVTLLEIDKKKVDLINKRQSFMGDEAINVALKNKSINLEAISDHKTAYQKGDLFIICTPTNFDQDLHQFDTQGIEKILADIHSYAKPKLTVIKSTVPIGFTSHMQERFNSKKIVFSPEFLREGSALTDNLEPSRIVVGSSSPEAVLFCNILKEAANKESISCIFTSPDEAESIKLFSNTYLAMRVAFFNEVDTFALTHNINSEQLIEGVCLDPRIGNYYNNPSFGYGGYCLPKDSMQLESNFDNIPQSLISATVKSNQLRKSFIANKIINLKPSKVGIYRLNMKKDSDNFRSSAILEIIHELHKAGIVILIYEPTHKKSFWQSFPLEANLEKFKLKCDLIVCNRKDELLKDVEDKVFSRDIYQVN
jgi:UDPglucose 6-dehydrogenase